jgi:hypothetical protein
MEKQTTEEQVPVAPQEPSVVESLVEHIESYTKTTIELTKLKTLRGGSKAASNAAVTVVLLLLGCFTLLFLSTGAAIWIGKLLDSVYAGFFIVAGFYAVLGLLFYLLRDRLIKRPISNSIIQHFID